MFIHAPDVKEGRGLLNTVIDKLPLELHIPGYKFCGPGTNLKKRLARGDQGINPLDRACKQHDIAYHKNKTVGKRQEADRVLIEAAQKRVKSSTSFWERSAAQVVGSLLSAKMKTGMGVKKKKTKSRKIPVAKRGGFLVPLIAGLGTAVTAGTSIAKTIKDAANAKKILQETERHNRAMEALAKTGKGMFLKPYKRTGGAVKKGKKKTKKTKKQNQSHFL